MALKATLKTEMIEPDQMILLRNYKEQIWMGKTERT
jgi:hypothetical protein